MARARRSSRRGGSRPVSGDAYRGRHQEAASASHGPGPPYIGAGHLLEQREVEDAGRLQEADGLQIVEFGGPMSPDMVEVIDLSDGYGLRTKT